MTVRDLPGQERSSNGPEDANDSSPPPAEHSLEIELKLAGAFDTLENLFKSAIAPRAKTVSRHLISSYFDTEDLRLRRRGFTLRVRQDGDGFVQTVKAEKGSMQGVMRRGEWTTPIDGPTPDLARLGDPEVREKIGLIVPGELQPIFTTDVTRHIKKYRINRKGTEKASIEAALDRGEIRCNGVTEPISEIELELLQGSHITLQREAARLHKKLALRFQSLSKAERGFALGLGERPRGEKANPPKLKSDTSVEESLERIMANCVSHWLANHAAVLDGGDIEGVHQMRVALRRMRSALTIFKDVLPADDLAWLQREAKSLIGALGTARDWDVFDDELLRPVLNAHPEDAKLKILQEAVNEERRLAYEHARATLGSPAYLRFILELGAWLEDRGWRRAETQNGLDKDLINLADEVLRKRHKQVMKLGRNFDDLADEALHELRISLKKLRYATEFFGSLYGRSRTKAYLKSLRQLQDDLGHLNDVAVAESRLADLCSSIASDNTGALQMASGTVIGWYSHALAQVRPRIAKDWYAFTEAENFWKH